MNVHDATIAQNFRYYFVYRVPLSGKPPAVVAQGFAALDEQGRPSPTTAAAAQASLVKAIRKAQGQGLKPAETGSIAAVYRNGRWEVGKITLFPKVAGS